MAQKLFDEKSSGGVALRAWSETLAMQYVSATKSKIILKQQLAEELHKSIIETKNILML